MATTADLGRSLGLSPQSTIYSGYSGSLQRTLLAMDSVWDWRVLHPELRRRLLHLWMRHPRTVKSGTDSQGLAILHSPMGNGSSGRDPVAQLAEALRRHSTTTNYGLGSRKYDGKTYYLRPGFAPYAFPGSSLHETLQRMEGWCAACDQVGWQDHWAHNNVAESQLQTFRYVNNEEWHLQDAHMPKSRRDFETALILGDRIETRSLSKIPLASSAETQPVPPTAPFNPANNEFGLWPFDTAKPSLYEGMESSVNRVEATRYLQAVLAAEGLYAGKIDGGFGAMTTFATNRFQALNGLTMDGRVGPQTWVRIDASAARLQAPPTNPNQPARIAMADKFEFTAPYRWDTRGFGVIPAGQYDLGIPGASGKVGIKGNLTIVPATAAGYATAWIGNTPAPNFSSLNFSPSTGPVANQVDVALASDGTFKVYISAPASIIFDLVGFWV